MSRCLSFTFWPKRPVLADVVLLSLCQQIHQTVQTNNMSPPLGSGNNAVFTGVSKTCLSFVLLCNRGLDLVSRTDPLLLWGLFTKGNILHLLFLFNMTLFSSYTVCTFTVPLHASTLVLVGLTLHLALVLLYVRKPSLSPRQQCVMFSL